MDTYSLYYRGYKGIIVYDNEDNIYHGELTDIDDYIYFSRSNKRRSRENVPPIY